MQNIIQKTHPEWQFILRRSLKTMNRDYLKTLQDNTDWLPELDLLFSAFNQPLSSTRFILFGESPYPRKASANGYAFWDASVDSLWSETGLSKAVNKATSLRNLIKMLLFARGCLTNDFSQAAIARLDKSKYIQTASDLFRALMQHGFLLLNATLVYSPGKVPYHARQWRPFVENLLNQLGDYDPSLQLVVLGKIAEKIPETSLLPGLLAEHPYNISFITNPKVVAFFKPMDLLGQHDKNNN